MRKLILFMLFGICWSAAGQNICGSILSTHRFEEYVEAIAPYDLTQQSLQDAGNILNDAFLRFVFAQDDHLRAGLTADVAQKRLATGFTQFNLAVNSEVKGWFKSRDIHLADLKTSLDEILRTPVPKDALFKVTRDLARQPRLEEALALAPFLMQQNESLLRIFLLSLYHDSSRTLSFGPREMALAREALQYAHLTADDHVVQLGVESPAALTAMRHYLGQVHFRGFSDSEPSAAALTWTNLFGVSLSRGDLGQSVEELPAKSVRMIMALDGLGDGANQLAGPEQLSSLKQLLVPSGSVVLVYDYAREPDFTDIEARELGFQVLSWRRPRHLDADLAEVVYGSARSPEAGHLNAFVLRLGDEDVDRRPPRTNSIDLPAR